MALRSFKILCWFIVSTSIASAQDMDRLRKKAGEALEYCRSHSMDTTFCLLVDMGIHSGKFRLFEWNFEEGTVVKSSLCSLGSCGGDHNGIPKASDFSNVSGSGCSSLGKYRIGKRSYSNWGINVHYKLHGLESTNNNAFRRIIVLHSWANIKNEEIYPWKASESLGCPIVSDETMRYLDTRLRVKENKVLLWIFR